MHKLAARSPVTRVHVHMHVYTNREKDIWMDTSYIKAICKNVRSFVRDKSEHGCYLPGLKSSSWTRAQCLSLHRHTEIDIRTVMNSSITWLICTASTPAL
jgi:hypothetical protein